jgi:hypothetical protein
MTPEQYKSAGLDKLTEGERAALDKWLREYTSSTAVTTVIKPVTPAPAAVTAATVAPAPTITATTAMVAQPVPKQIVQEKAQPLPAAEDKNFGFPEPPVDLPEDSDALHAKVLPPFRGWSGKTVFKLDNGQVWRQRTSGRHTYTGDDTRVVISKNSWGFYEMRLVDADRSVGVKRVK